MVQKRPFDAEEILEVSFKHPKQEGPSNPLVSVSESVFTEDACQLPKTSEVGCRQVGTEGEEKFASDMFVELPRGAGDVKTSFPGNISVSSWPTSTTSEEDVRSELPLHVSFFPDYLSPERPIRTFARYEDIYSILLERPPRKLVPIGADHQADIPPLNLLGATGRLDTSDAASNSNFAVGDEVEKRLMGTCIIPIPHMELSTYDNETVGEGRTDCSCEDRGSVRCVRQHILEAREELIKANGKERFGDLGFCDMGEQVAEKWSAEDEQLFHEVVFNNPASMGKNFWNYLPGVFPSRTKKDLVSYYFNVFLLRRRAEQNRNDLLNIDSDNDEWQGTDDNDIATHDEDEDSVAESPVYQDETGVTNSHENDMQDYEDYTAEDTCDANVSADFTRRDIDDYSKYDPAEMPRSSGSSPPVESHDQAVWQERCGKVQDDSCTSSETGVASQESMVKAKNVDHWPGNYNGNGCSQGYVLEPCDAKAWDPSFVSCSKNKIDFLPTCNMIEEVFGDELRQEMRKV